MKQLFIFATALLIASCATRKNTLSANELMIQLLKLIVLCYMFIQYITMTKFRQYQLIINIKTSNEILKTFISKNKTNSM